MAELTYQGVLELFAESDRRSSENNERFERQLEKVTKQLDKRFAQTNKQIADLGDTLGRFAEEQVRADFNQQV